MEKNKNELRSRSPLLMAFMISVSLGLFIFLIPILKSVYTILPEPTNTILTITTNPSLTLALQPSPSATPFIELSITPPMTPTLGVSYTPILGVAETNVPIEFRVGPWHDNSINCDNNPQNYLVEIKGVEISGGNPPYKFQFTQFGRQNIISAAPSEHGLIIFNQPIRITKGEFIHVEIIFHLKDGTRSTWINDLYYPYLNDPHCTTE